MGNLNYLTPKDFGKSHRKKGYKEIGWTYAKIIRSSGEFDITAPYERNEKAYNNGQEGEYLVWEDDEPIAEFKHKEDAIEFFRHKVRNKIYSTEGRVV